MNDVPQPKYSLKILGRFELLGPDGPIEMPNKKLAGLLAYLACTVPLPQPRQKLAALLWGSHFETQAQQNLRQALFRLRRALGRDALMSDGDEVWLAPGVIDCDVTRLEALSGEGSRTSLAAAADLYQGPLLAGVNIAEEAWADWLAAERLRLEGLALDAMIRHAGQALHSANAESALKVAHRAIALNALREDAHRVIVQALAATGRKAEALKHYRDLVVLLKRELNTEPDRVTQSLVAGLGTEAGLAGEAIEYSVKAGRLAYARWAYRDAVEFFDWALGTLASLPESPSTLEQAFDIRLELPQALIQLGEVRRALERLQEAKILAERLGDDRRRCRVFSFTTIVHALFGELGQALPTGVRALEIARRLGDLRLVIPATTILQQVHFYRGEHERVTVLAAENLALLPADSVTEDFGLATPPAIYDRGRLIISLAELGRFAEATELEAQVLRLAAQTQHAYTVGWAHLAASWVHLLRGDWAQASPGVEHATAILRKRDVVPLLPFAVGLSAWGLAQLGDTSEALSRLREGEQLLERHALSGLTGTLGWFYVGLGRAALVLGRLEHARRLGGRALEFSPRQPGFAAHALQLLGDVAAHPDQFDAARSESHYRQALALAEPSGMRPVVAHCHLGLGKLYRRTDERKQAKEHLTIAMTMYREMGMRFWIEQADAAIREPTLEPHRDLGEIAKPAAQRTDDAPIAIEHAVDAMAGSAERRPLTIMACNMVGSMALAARLDPEDMRALIDTFHKEVAAVVSRFGGFIAQYLGDGAIVYFGYPTAHEHDAERAVRAGLAIIDAPGRLNAVSGVRVQARIGIATGVVVVGERLGPDDIGQRVAIGETPILAARLQAMAGPGEIVIAAGTRRLVGQMFDCLALVADEAKGLPQPAEAWEVRGVAAAVSRFEARRAGPLSPLVGRQEEMELLLRRWDQAKFGEGRVVLISGEPGMGKSRIAESLLTALEGEPHARLRYFCSPHYEHSVLHPFVAQLERAAGFAPGSNAEAKLDRLEALLGPTAPPRDVTLMADLLGVPIGGRYPTLAASPQQQREMTLAAFLDQLDRLAAQGSVLIVLEDAHWIDPTSQDLLDRTVTHIANRPVLLVVAARPEFQPAWIGQPHVTMLPLSRLGRRDSAAIIAGITGDKALPDAVVEQVLAATDGVPLFIEELTNTLLEGGLLRETTDRYVLDGPLPSLAMPTTLQASLVARLDRLGPVKDVAQIGAAIGREFSHELVAAVSDLAPMDLAAGLERLTGSGLVSRRGTPPDATYSFKHALVQDAAYGTLLKSRRRQLHSSVAKVLVERFPATAESQPEVVAHHFTEAGLASEAIGYWRRAGQLAAARSANREAATSFERALHLLKTQPQTRERLEQAIDLRFDLRATLFQLGEFERIAGYLREAEGMARTLDDQQRLGQLSVYLCHNRGMAGQLREAIGFGQNAQAIAESLGDVPLQVTANLDLGVVCVYAGDYRRAEELFRKVLGWLEGDRRRERFGQTIFPAVAAFGYLTWIFADQGRFKEGIAYGEEGLRLAEALDHPYSLAFALWAFARAHIVKGDLSDAAGLLERGMALSREWNLTFLSILNTGGLGYAYALSGRMAEAIPLLKQALSANEATRAGAMMLPLCLMYLGEACILADQLEDAIAFVGRALPLARECGQRGYEAPSLRLLGEIAARRDPPAQARGYYDDALALAEKLGFRPLIAHCHLGLGKLYRRTGTRKRTSEHLATATAMYRDMDMPFWLEQAEAKILGPT